MWKNCWQWCDSNEYIMKNEEEKTPEPHDYDNPKHYYNNCREDIKNMMTEQERKNAAKSFGANWVNILSGLGDQ